MAEMTLEELKAHIQQANLEQYTKRPESLSPGARQDIEDVLKTVCGVYKGIKPILGIIVSIPIIPPFITAALRTFMSVMDGVCAG
jgi:hypothetical protein